MAGALRDRGFFPLPLRFHPLKSVLVFSLLLWQRQASWLPSSPQAYSKWYNAIVMSKLYWLADLCVRNPFHTRYFVWVDAGICTRTMLGPRNLDRLKQRCATCPRLRQGPIYSQDMCSVTRSNIGPAPCYYYLSCAGCARTCGVTGFGFAMHRTGAAERCTDSLANRCMSTPAGEK